MKNSIYSLDKLQNSKLLKSKFNVKDIEMFEPIEWIPRIDELDYIKPDESFYQKLGKLYGLDYMAEISVPLNPKDAIAYRVPTEILIEAQLYPFNKNGKLYVATSTPFIKEEVLQNVLSYTGQAGYELVITKPLRLREALKYQYYIEFSAVAEGNLKLTKNRLSASPPFISRFARVIVVISIIIILGAFIFPRNFLLVLFFAVNLFYIFLNSIKLVTFLRSLSKDKSVTVKIDHNTISTLDDESLPRYTILVPLRFEKLIVKHLVEGLAKIDYPKSRLEIMFLLGVDDTETIDALKAIGVDSEDGTASKYDHYMSIVKVPKVRVDTKPLVCNYGLRFATGDYTVIYDAEDSPEPDQLKKAVLGFQRCSLDTICLQGKLNFYNSRKNLLTKFFSLEYGMWYNYFLPGLQLIGSPIPLGGTSNHFVTKTLRQTGEWDPYNVTEDADLGMRIYRGNYRTQILESYTYEEATSKVKAWLKQRARWEKGFLATLIVHLQHPITLYKELGFKKFVYGVTVFFGNFYMPFINPLLWLITVLYLLNILSVGKLPVYIFIPALFNLIVGNLLYLVMHISSAILMKRYDLVPLALLMPIYWLLISIATYMASWEIITRPYAWNKTSHGS